MLLTVDPRSDLRSNLLSIVVIACSVMLLRSDGVVGHGAKKKTERAGILATLVTFNTLTNKRATITKREVSFHQLRV